MFAKKKYVRKRPDRKHVRRRAGRKSRILRPHFEPQVPEKPTFNASGCSPYLWMNIRSGVTGLCKQPNSENPSNPVKSLRLICAKTVASNVECLHSSYFCEASWTCWKLVWEEALKQGTDLPQLFRLFTDTFGLERNFSCHPPIHGTIERVHGSTADLKRSALLASSIPNHPRHRIENVFSNISIPDFVLFVGSSNNCAVVINCAKIALYSTPTLLSLCKTPTVSAIDISYNSVVDDQFLHTLNACLVTGTSSLKLLRVCGCPAVTVKGILNLLEARQNSSLVYVETDVSLPRLSMFSSRFLHLPDYKEDPPILGTRWRMVNEEHSEMAFIAKHSLATKLHYFLRLKKLFNSSNVIWDFKFFNEVADQSMNIEDFNEIVWLDRLHTAVRKKITLPHMYFKDPTLQVVPRIVRDERPSEMKSIDRSKAESSTTRKPKFVKTNADSFFFGI